MKEDRLTTKQAEQLAVQIPKESIQQVRAKVGNVSGVPVVHVNQLEVDDRRTASFDIRSEPDWNEHPLNRANRKKRREAKADEATVTTRLSPKAKAQIKGRENA
jgi:hypothetical protein